MPDTSKEQVQELRDFGRRFSDFMTWANDLGRSQGHPVTVLLREHLGANADEPAVRRQWGRL